MRAARDPGASRRHGRRNSTEETENLLRELAELIFVNPYCRIGDVVKADIAKRQTAAVYLKALAAEGILEEIKAGRENLYINPTRRS